jgi:hypothetical protein
MPKATAIPASARRFVQELISHGWPPIPAERPSFQEILAELREHEFGVMADVDSKAVESYLTWVAKCHST